ATATTTRAVRNTLTHRLLKSLTVNSSHISQYEFFSISEKTARAMRAYHELNCDVGNLKVKIQDALAQQKAKNNEASSFIKACRVMDQKVFKDIERLKRHCENYGYQAKDEEADDDSVEEENQEEDGGNPSSMAPKPELPNTDVLRTPQLSDFGLSELHLRRVLAGTEWCSEVPPMPEMNLPQPSLKASLPSPMPITPKCNLRMDDYELQTPQMHDFGITEHTMSEKLESPEPPVFCTPGFKIKKTNGHSSPTAQGTGVPEFPCHPGNLPATPEVPAFQTPYVNRLVSTKKSTQQPEASVMQTDNDTQTLDLPSPPCNRAAGFKRTWEYDVPDISTTGLEDKQFFSCHLQSNGKILKFSENEKVAKEPNVNSLELDGLTQEFSLGTPRIRAHYQEPTTPEMPDLSSVTQDICKSFFQNFDCDVSPSIHSSPRSASLPEVSENEFQSLPSYLRQMSLNTLISLICPFSVAPSAGETTEFQMEKLKKIISVGTKAPVYILCLTELKRLKHVRGDRNTSVYRLITHI
uniref:Spindle and kinetochore-associated protein 3 n=1 Tax=Astatotilapia calliptera TaxID=8154 RepID=A0A3P8Q8D6_ASTCA